jgi:hypothetical protein
MKNLSIVLIIMMGIALSFTSCKKYDDGPMLSFRFKKARVVNTWVIEKLIIDGTDVSADTNYVDPNQKFEMTKDKKYTTTIGNLIIEKGTWDFGSKKETIETQEDGSSTKEISTILKLRDKQLWTTRTETIGLGSVTIETHLKAE